MAYNCELKKYDHRHHSQSHFTNIFCYNDMKQAKHAHGQKLAPVNNKL